MHHQKRRQHHGGKRNAAISMAQIEPTPKHQLTRAHHLAGFDQNLILNILSSASRDPPALSPSPAFFFFCFFFFFPSTFHHEGFEFALAFEATRQTAQDKKVVVDLLAGLDSLEALWIWVSLTMKQGSVQKTTGRHETYSTYQNLGIQVDTLLVAALVFHGFPMIEWTISSDKGLTIRCVLMHSRYVLGNWNKTILSEIFNLAHPGA